MFRHLILGLLRDGEPRHGYGLMTEYRARSGSRISVGNLYRELARLVTAGLAQTGVNPPDADPRRIPYQITHHGCQAFDQWLVAPVNHEGELSERLVFVDQIPPAVLARLMDRWQEDLWQRGKLLGREREDVLGNHAPGNPAGRAAGRYNSLPLLLSRQLKHVTAELEFLKEFRVDFEAWAQHKRTETEERGPGASGGGRSGNRRDK